MHAEIDPKQAELLIARLDSLEDPEQLWALDHYPLCVDRPSIRFQKADGEYYDLDSVSIGQKCTALLIIALTEATRPAIIDQPEDALDTPSVYGDVTRQLRSMKTQRQFILTTHNSTVAVASDSDQYHVLEATATSAGVTVTGAMDRPKVLHQVIQHLEGGKEPFALKAKKYGGQGGVFGSPKR